MEAIHIHITSIKSNPRQPRSIFDASEMASLVESVKQHGILQPLLVTMSDEGGIYVLIAGERRLRAAREAGLEEVPAVVLPNASEQEQLELALIENVQRADLNPLEKARAYQQLIDVFSLSHEDVAARVGQHRSTVSNTLRLLKLPDGIQKSLLGGSISERQATALLALYDLPQPLRERAEASRSYSPELKPSIIEQKVLGGASSDYVRDTIGGMISMYSNRLLWASDVAFAVPAEMPACCVDCTNLFKRGGEDLCGDETCFNVRKNAYNHQRLPLPEPSPAAVSAPAPAPLPRPAPVAPPRVQESEEPEEDTQPDADQEQSPAVSVVEYATVTDVAAGSEPAPTESALTPPVAAPPVPGLDWEHSTLLITITYSPVDGSPDGRSVWVGLRANHDAPAIRMCREKETLLPGWLAGLLLDMETKFKEA
jgi:ParB/RepB/Spo0J family partition protein